MSEWYVEFRDHDGTLRAVFDDWNSLQLEHTLNSYSSHTLSVLDGDPRLDFVYTDSIVVARRRIPEVGLDWYAEYVGFHRTPQHQTTELGVQLYTSYGRGLVDLIRRKKILQYSGSGESDKEGPGETVMHEFVDENGGPGTVATIADQTLPSFTLGPDLGRGLYWQGARAWRDLLATVQEIADFSGVDFDVIANELEPPAFQFRTYWPQRGLDRTYGNADGNSPVIFSTDFANLSKPSFTVSRTEEATAVLALGQGQEEQRDYVLVESPDKDDSPWNYIVATKNASQEEEADGLEDAALAELARVGKQESFAGEILQTSSFVYGRDYFVGDLVTCRYGSIERNKKVLGARIVVAEGKETISITLGDLPQ